MLSVIHRFHGHGSLRYVYKNGTAIRSHMMTLKYTANPHRAHTRFTVVVSKKVLKSAVGRNRIRRRLYEIFRAELPNIVSPHDLVLMVFSSEVKELPQTELKDLVVQLLEQASLYKS